MFYFTTVTPTFVVINKWFSVSGDWSPENHLAPYHFADVTRMPFAMFLLVVYLCSTSPSCFLAICLDLCKCFWRKRCYVCFRFALQASKKTPDRRLYYKVSSNQVSSKVSIAKCATSLCCVTMKYET